jgi:RimJ/RimL family protein N-acetyltransferase
MTVTFRPVDPDEAEALIDLIASDTWQYYVNTNPSHALVREWYEQGRFTGADNQFFWIISDEPAGLIGIHDLLDSEPLLEFRIKSAYRGQGIGTLALHWVTQHIFTTWPQMLRISGQTRQDNLTMRKLFRRCGYTKEAHHRQGWPTLDGPRYDSIGYTILRQDWQSGTPTPVNWNDEPE